MKILFFSRANGKSTVLFILFLVLMVAIGIITQQTSKKAASLPVFDKLIMLPNAKQLGAVNFTDHDNQAFTEQNLVGKWSILFFAFTHCPDICPSTLQVLKNVKQDLMEAGVWDAYQLAMISVDPERDTPERMKQYVPFFDPEFIGLTAELTYTESFAKNLGILFFKSKTMDNGGYDVDHGASLILINPLGEYAGVISAPHKREELSADLIKLGRHAIQHNTVNLKTNDQPIISNASNTIADPEPEPANTSTPATGLSFNNTWIRPAPPGAAAMAGYFSVTNNSGHTITIESVQSPLFNMAMIHNTIIEDGVASMQHLDELSIKPNQTLELKPLGTHLMLMQPTQTLPLDTVVPITLNLASGETIDLSITVQNNPKG